MHRRKNNPLRIIAVVAAALLAGAIVLAAFAASANDSPASNDEPVSFTGAWSAKTNNGQMNAIITDDGIEIYFVDGESSALYWDGTFPVPVNVASNATYTITSIGNVPEMEGSVLGSQDKSKVFTYKDGKLSFQLTVAGVKTTVHLSR